MPTLEGNKLYTPSGYIFRGILLLRLALAGVVSSMQDKGGGLPTFLVEAFFQLERSTGMNLKPLRIGGMARQNSGRAMAPIMIG